MKNKKLWIFLFLVAIFLLALFFLPVKEIFQGNVLQFLQEKSEENFLLSALLYVVLCALAGAFLALPGITYALIAGTVFHAFWGTVLCALSASISAGISFLMGRYFLHDAIKPKLEKNPYIKKYFFSFVGDPGREYTASLLVHLLLQFFSTLFLATYLRKDYRDEK